MPLIENIPVDKSLDIGTEKLLKISLHGSSRLHLLYSISSKRSGMLICLTIFDLRCLFSSFLNDTFPWRREVPRSCFDGIIWNRGKPAKLSDRSYDLVPEYPFLRQTGKVTLETFGLLTGPRNFVAPDTITYFAPKRYMYFFSFLSCVIYYRDQMRLLGFQRRTKGI